MFESSDHSKSLDENLFETWLEKGRTNKIGYSYLLIVWDEFESSYQPVYLEDRDELNAYAEGAPLTGSQSFVAAYDLYSESRIM